MFSAPPSRLMIQKPTVYRHSRRELDSSDSRHLNPKAGPGTTDSEIKTKRLFILIPELSFEDHRLRSHDGGLKVGPQNSAAEWGTGVLYTQSCGAQSACESPTSNTYVYNLLECISLSNIYRYIAYIHHWCSRHRKQDIQNHTKLL